MAKTIQAIRGMKDILPVHSQDWRYVESVIQSVLARYGYEEIRMPIVESTDLFKRSIGEVTDIVEKEMYTFEDRNGDSLTLRPEGTAGCVRAGIENGLLFNQVQRLWYQGPMFRHERPQQGRYRQFHQIGVEVYGLSGPDIDLEQMLMLSRVWRELALDDLRLELNTLGTPEERVRYREDLVSYFESRLDELDEDSQRRLRSNPLRILDSKNPAMRDLIDNAPSMMAYLSETTKAHFDHICEGLDAAGIPYVVNPRLVRGLDYYNQTVYEWVTDELGAQGTVCAGGRYDGLVSQLGGKSTPAIGFAMGMERLLALLNQHESIPFQPRVDCYLVMLGERAQREGMLLAETIRDDLPSLKLLSHCGGGGFKTQFKKADKSQASYALVLGDEELDEGVVGLKPLRDDSGQRRIPRGELTKFLSALIST